MITKLHSAALRGVDAVEVEVEVNSPGAGAPKMLMAGPPGTGKSMLAKRIPTILPDMTEAEAIETTRVHSITGLLDPKAGLLRTRPFRSPHHTISDAGLLGGGSNRSGGLSWGGAGGVAD